MEPANIILYNIHALTLGASYRLTSATTRAPEVHVGGQLTGYVPDQRIRGNVGVYGQPQQGYSTPPSPPPSTCA